MTTVDRPPGQAELDLDAEFRRHADRLWSVALRMLAGDTAEAEDAVQEAFLAALRSPGFRGASSGGTWLHRILVNGCVDRIRAAERRRGHTRDLAPAAVTADPSGRLVTALTVERALALLPAEQRAAVVLVHLHDVPVTEAAEMIGVPAGTVKSRCARGRRTMARVLADRRDEER